MIKVDDNCSRWRWVWEALRGRMPYLIGKTFELGYNYGWRDRGNLQTKELNPIVGGKKRNDKSLLN